MATNPYAGAMSFTVGQPGSLSTPVSATDVSRQQMGATGATSQDQFMSWLNKSGLNLDQQTQQFLQDIADMEATSGRTGLLAGFKLPSDMATHDFFATVSDAEQWAASIGWKYFPTPNELLAITRATETGVEAGRFDQTRAFQIFSDWAGINDKMPWARVGLSQSAFSDKVATFNDSYEALTGQRLDASDPLLASAVQNRMTSEQFQNHIQNDPGVQQRFGFVKYGYTYNSWQQYKQQHLQAVQQRYGATTPTEAQFTEALLTSPNQPFQAPGAQTKPLAPRGAAQGSQAAASLSEVR